jgi:antitoxin component of MazEF toxin-antitoxin module
MNKLEKQILSRKIIKMPHSVALVIPKFWADLHGIETGDKIEVEVQLNRLIISIPGKKEGEK